MALRRGLVMGIGVLLWAQAGRCPVDRAFLRMPQGYRASLRLQDTGDTLWVPVVFHVVAADSSRWLPAGRILDQLIALNRDFAQAKIQFYLPARGPQGQPTCGITWTVSPLGLAHDYRTEEDSLKNLIHWPIDSFVNIWVVQNTADNTIGYARALSDTTGMPGIVLIQAVTGNRIGTQRPFDWGRTGVHEMGHVFSLLHPFEGGCRGLTPTDCAVQGDEICDTPGQQAPSFDCPALGSQNTCVDQPIDLPDPVDNFMGYVDDSCMVHFTAMQVARMRSYLLTAGATLVSPANRNARGNALQQSACAAILALARPVPPPHAIFLFSDRIEISPAAPLILYDLMGRVLRQSYGLLSLEGLPVGGYLLWSPALPKAQKFFYFYP